MVAHNGVNEIMNISRVIINPANGMAVRTWIVYERPQSGGYIATDHAGKSFYGNTELEAVLHRARKGRVFSCMNKADIAVGIIYV